MPCAWRSAARGPRAGSARTSPPGRRVRCPATPARGHTGRSRRATRYRWCRRPPSAAPAVPRPGAATRSCSRCRGGSPTPLPGWSRRQAGRRRIGPRTRQSSWLPPRRGPRSAHMPRYPGGWPDHTNPGRLTQRQIAVRIRDISTGAAIQPPCARRGLLPRARIRRRGSTRRRTVPLRTCCPAVPPTLHQAPPFRHHEKHRREPLASVRVPAEWLLSSASHTTWRPCSTSGCRCTPDRHRGPEGLAEARCRTRSTGLLPTAGAGCAA